MRFLLLLCNTLWIVSAARATESSSSSPPAWPTYSPGEPREGEPIYPIVPADASDPKVIADATWAIEYLKGMSDSGVYRTLALVRVLDASTQEGVFHNNTIVKVVLASPHQASSDGESTFVLIIMTDLESGERRAFAIDEFPIMKPEAVEAFWRDKVDAHREERERMFAALEADFKNEMGGSGHRLKGDGATASSSASSSSISIDAGGAFSQQEDASLTSSSETSQRDVPQLQPPQQQHQQQQQQQQPPPPIPRITSDEGSCISPELSEAALREIKRRLENPGDLRLDDPAFVAASFGSGAARVLETATTIQAETPSEAEIAKQRKDHERHMKKMERDQRKAEMDNQARIDEERRTGVVDEVDRRKVGGA